MALTPLDRQKKEFKRSFRGYCEQDVDDFLDQLVQDYESLQRQNITLTEKLEISEVACSRYRDMEMLIKDALVLAQKNADELLRNAKQEAEVILEEARLDAEKIIETAQRKAEQSLREAREKASFRIKEADEQVKNKLSEYRFLEKQTHIFRIRFRSFLDAQIRLLDSQEEQAQELMNSKQLGLVEVAVSLDEKPEVDEQIIGAVNQANMLEDKECSSNMSALNQQPG